jgi:Transmembrane domain of unknown function (DUF3566)
VADRPHSLDPADDGADPSDRGWGSPVPAEYGSLRAVRWSQGEVNATEAAGRPDHSRQSGTGWRWQRQIRNRGGAEAPKPITPVADLGGASDPAAPWSWDPDAGDGAAGDGKAGDGAVDGAVAGYGPAVAAPTVEQEDELPTPAAPGPQALLLTEPEAAGMGGPPVLTAGPAAAGAIAATQVRHRRRANRRPERVRSRVTVRHVDVLTVARVSIIFYLLVAIAIVVASVLLWYAANAYGSLDSIEKSVRTLFDLKTFTLHVDRVAEYTAAGGLVLAFVGTLANVLAALTYNLICDIVGGFRIEVESTSPGSTEV